MDPWQTILLAFGGNAALLAVLGLLGKSLLEKLITRDTKRYEATLKAKTDAAIERLRNDLMRGVESYKVQLKKSEFFFQKEFEAASELTTRLQSILPAFSAPDMGWHETCDEIALSFEKNEKILNAFLASYGPVLTEGERELLSSAASDAGVGKFKVHGREVSPHANQLADSMYEKMKQLESGLIKRIHDQSSL